MDLKGSRPWNGSQLVFQMLNYQSHPLCQVWCGDWAPGSAVNLPLQSPALARNTHYRYYNKTQYWNAELNLNMQQFLICFVEVIVQFRDHIPWQCPIKYFILLCTCYVVSHAGSVHDLSQTWYFRRERLQGGQSSAMTARFTAHRASKSYLLWFTTSENTSALYGRTLHICFVV